MTSEIKIATRHKHTMPGHSAKNSILSRELHGDKKSSPFPHTMFCPHDRRYHGNTTEIVLIIANTMVLPR